MKRMHLVLIFIGIMAIKGHAQKLNSMNWLNEPAEWEIKDNKLTMQVTPQSDYWNKSHYGFTVYDTIFVYRKKRRV